MFTGIHVRRMLTCKLFSTLVRLFLLRANDEELTVVLGSCEAVTTAPPVTGMMSNRSIV